MSWIIGILTFILVLNSLLLILLILVQLPKKEAGLGTAFGSSTTDALFGAGTGNVLTKLTKYCTVVFFAITLSLSVMNTHQSRAKRSSLEESLRTVRQEQQADEPGSPPPVATDPQVATNPAPAPLATGLTNALITPTNATAPSPAAPISPSQPPPPADTPEKPADTPEKPAEDPPPPPSSTEPR